MKRRSFIGALVSVVLAGKTASAEPTRQAGRQMRELWTHGYTSGELEAAQERYQLRFPPDLIALLLDPPPGGWMGLAQR